MSKMRTVIKSLSATSGFLQNAPTKFAPGLNCIIGARGTCKSTLVESIRFAFDSNPERVASLTSEARPLGEPSAGMVRYTLGPGSIRCEVALIGGHDDEESVVLEREVGNPPRIFVDGVREHEQHEVLRNIEIYSQGDLQRIADDSDDGLRVSLIDRPHARDIARLESERSAAANALISIGASLRSLRAHISALRQEVQPVGNLRDQLRQVEAGAPSLTPELEKERALFEQRRRLLENLREVAAVQDGVVSQISALSSSAQRLQFLNAEIERDAVEEIAAASSLTGAFRALLHSALSDLSDVRALDLVGMAKELELTFERANEPFYRLRQEQQAVNESLKQQAHLRRQLEFLEKRNGELHSARDEEQALLRRRQDIRSRIAEIDNDIFSLRIGEIEQINQEHGNTVHLTLISGTQSPEYLSRLSSMLTGSRVRAQEDVASALAGTFAPSDLVDIIESADSQQLARVLDRDLGQMNRVVAHLGHHSELYTLEATPIRPRLEITMYDEGVPKPVETLSKGQKATALLPLILRPLPYPLLFDQPEDDLDNSFIFRSLISTVRELKTHRQIIFVTHNANIPVLGEADAVIVMSMKNPKQAKLPKSGTVDQCKREILELLEGGPDAFRLREEKYHDLLEV